MNMEYTFAHMGIHCNSEEDCKAGVAAFQTVFGFPIFDIGNSVIVAGPMELTKTPLRSAAGHIGIACTDVALAIEDLKEKGFAIDESTLQYGPDGKLRSVYLQDTFCGFACHLLQKRR